MKKNRNAYIGGISLHHIVQQHKRIAHQDKKYTNGEDSVHISAVFTLHPSQVLWPIERVATREERIDHFVGHGREQGIDCLQRGEERERERERENERNNGLGGGNTNIDYVQQTGAWDLKKQMFQ